MGLTGITHMRLRLIKNLSKGRGGICLRPAGDLQVIILDELTVGLDPRQIIEIRTDQSLGKAYCDLSVPYPSEVSAVCDHILIISKEAGGQQYAGRA